MMKLYLMSEKGYIVLDALIKKNFKKYIDQIVVGRDEMVANDFSEEIIQLADSNGINWCFKSEEGYAEVGLAISWKWIIGSDKCRTLYVIHDSLLPKYRGFNPLVSCLINGEQYIGATLLRASEKYDEGDIVYQKKVAVDYPCKIQKAILQISDIYADLTIKLIEAIRDKEDLPSIPQHNENATYSLWRDTFDYRIDWRDSADRISRFVDAVGFPYRGAKTLMNNEIAIVREALSLPDVVIENRVAGKIIFMDGGRPVVVCGQGLLKICGIEDQSGKSLIPLRKFRIRFE